MKNRLPIRRFEMLGTLNEIQVHGFQGDADDIEKILDQIIERVSEIDDRMSAFKKNSDIARLNRSAGCQPVVLHEDVFHVLSTAYQFGENTNDAFDCTIRPLIELWGIGKKMNYIPNEQDIERTLELVNYRDLSFNSQAHSAFLKKKGQSVDLGGIAKGYAADEARRILMENGITDALINLGGNIHVIGSNPDNRPWQVGIQNPAAPTGASLGTLSVKDKTVVTSGSNERFFIQNGVRYHHLLDPHTGKPAQSGLLSVTAVMEDSIEADALTTALFVLGMEKGMEILNKFQADAIFITDTFQVYTTAGIKDDFVLKN